MEKRRIGVVIVAGGKGLRMGGTIPKQFAIVGGEPILARTINAFAKALPEAETVVVLPEESIPFWNNLKARFQVAKHKITAGGEQRYHSVKNGIEALESDPEIIAIQDGVRPFGSAEMIRRCIDCAAENGSAIPVVEPVDSFRIEENGESRPVDRSLLRMIQTPQCFRAELIKGAYSMPYSDSFTDDATVIEAAGHRVCLCEGERTNIKITRPADLSIAEAILESTEEQ